jgi:hypothetical protein
MTIEVKSTEYSHLGFKKTVKSRVLDFRGWNKKVSPTITISSSPDLILLHEGHVPEENTLPREYVFAHPISEDDLLIRKTNNLFELGENIIYSKEEINHANLISDDGEIIVWRKTQSGDYPPLEPGLEITPIQQILGL